MSELIVGIDVAAETTLGAENARLGAAVSLGEQLLVAAPGEGTVYADGVASDGPSSWVGELDGEVVRAGAGVLWIGGEAHAVEGARAYAVGGGEVLVATGGGVWSYPSATRLSSAAASGIAAGDGRVVVREAVGGCVVRELDRDLAIDVPCDEDGALAFDGGVVCAGAPALLDDEGHGEVRCEDGRAVSGEPGDHLGRALGGGYAMGSFNKWLVPALARVVPIGEGPVLALEQGAENQAHALAGDGQRLVIGAPYYPAGGLPSGAVFVVELP